MIRNAGLTDLPFLFDLTHREGETIGFIPSTCYERIIRGCYRATINVIEEGGDLAVDSSMLRIDSELPKSLSQCAVDRMGARRIKLASHLVDSVTQPNDIFVKLTTVLES